MKASGFGRRLGSTLVAAGVGLAYVAATPTALSGACSTEAAATAPAVGNAESVAGHSEPFRGTSAYAALGGDDRAIAMSLFLAQFKATEHPRADQAWSLEEIAGARLRWAGWGQVFHDLYTASLVDIDSLMRISAMRNFGTQDARREDHRHR